jgi:hypothetical protein
MCGIYGLFYKAAGGFFPGDLDTLKNQAIVTSLRGDHSSGIAVLRNDGSKRPWIVKTIGDPFNIFHNPEAMKEMKKFFEGSKASAGAFGHGRLATRGEISHRNAHPFVEGHITLVHNGTINAGLDMKQECEEGKQVDVDSHALAIEMSKIGVREALAKVNGAFAIIAHDQKEKCVYFARNKERPLHYLDHNTRLMVMSEFGALTYLGWRETKYQANSLRADLFKEFKENILYKYDLTKFTLTEEGPIKEVRTSSESGVPFYQSPKGGTVASKGEILLLLKKIIPPARKSKEYTYIFEDDELDEYIGRSSSLFDVNEGALATAPRFYMERVNGRAATRTVRMKEVEWYATVGDHPKTVTTINKKELSFEDWKEKRDQGCVSCSGPIEDKDAHRTMLTQTGNLICHECLATDGFSLSSVTTGVLQ